MQTHQARASDAADNTHTPLLERLKPCALLIIRVVRTSSVKNRALYKTLMVSRPAQDAFENKITKNFKKKMK
jgi:hypothetical protein